MSVVLSFPQRNKGRVRRCSSIDAGGMLKLHLMDREGVAFPVNVQRLDEPAGPALPEKSPALLLAMLAFAQLPPSKQERVKGQLRCLAYSAKNPDPAAVKLINVFSGRGRC